MTNNRDLFRAQLGIVTARVAGGPPPSVEGPACPGQIMLDCASTVKRAQAEPERAPSVRRPGRTARRVSVCVPST